MYKLILSIIGNTDKYRTSGSSALCPCLPTSVISLSLKKSHRNSLSILKLELKIPYKHHIHHTTSTTGYKNRKRLAPTIKTRLSITQTTTCRISIPSVTLMLKIPCEVPNLLRARIWVLCPKASHT